MLSTSVQYVFVFHSTCFCGNRMISIGHLIVSSSGNQQYNVGEKPALYLYDNLH